MGDVLDGDTLSPHGDPYYGQLFTRDDVRLMMHLASHQAWMQAKQILASGGHFTDGPTTDAEAKAQAEELLHDARAQGHLTFPVDEPLFLLRGTDLGSLPALGSYALACESLDASREHLQNVIAAASAMADWQLANVDRVHNPTTRFPTKET